MSNEKPEESGLTSKLDTSRYGRLLTQLPQPYDLTDISPFSPSAAIYFMDGYSDVTFSLHGSGEELYLEFWDQNTSISASSPLLYDNEVVTKGIYVPAPQPLRPAASYPKDTPERYTRPTNLHLMQVISMNMRAKDSPARLLIGLPYAEKYPELFFQTNIFENGDTASSYGVVQSLTEFSDSVTGDKTVSSNGYPARSFFAIYHILETKVGTFFNKKATQMELQPSEEGKLALALPPIPFVYSLINGPIPLFDVKDPNGDPIGELKAAHHESNRDARIPTEEAWPFHQPDLNRIEDALKKVGNQ
jgi:hypothetical protein